MDLVCVGALLLVLAHLCLADGIVDAEDVTCSCVILEAARRGSGEEIMYKGYRGSVLLCMTGASSVEGLKKAYE